MSDDMQFGRLYCAINYDGKKIYLADCTLGAHLTKKGVAMRVAPFDGIDTIYLNSIHNLFKDKSKWYVIYESSWGTKYTHVFPDSDTDISKQDAIMNETTSLLLGNTLQKDISRLQASLNDIMNMILYAPGNSMFKEAEADFHNHLKNT